MPLYTSKYPLSYYGDSGANLEQAAQERREFLAELRAQRAQNERYRQENEELRQRNQRQQESIDNLNRAARDESERTAERNAKAQREAAIEREAKKAPKAQPKRRSQPKVTSSSKSRSNKVVPEGQAKSNTIIPSAAEVNNGEPYEVPNRQRNPYNGGEPYEIPRSERPQGGGAGGGNWADLELGSTPHPAPSVPPAQPMNAQPMNAQPTAASASASEPARAESTGTGSERGTASPSSAGGSATASRQKAQGPNGPVSWSTNDGTSSGSILTDFTNGNNPASSEYGNLLQDIANIVQKYGPKALQSIHDVMSGAIDASSDVAGRELDAASNLAQRGVDAAESAATPPAYTPNEGSDLFNSLAVSDFVGNRDLVRPQAPVVRNPMPTLQLEQPDVMNGYELNRAAEEEAARATMLGPDGRPQAPLYGYSGSMRADYERFLEDQAINRELARQEEARQQRIMDLLALRVSQPDVVSAAQDRLPQYGTMIPFTAASEFGAQGQQRLDQIAAAQAALAARNAVRVPQLSTPSLSDVVFNR